MTMQTSAVDITMNKFSCRIQADEFQSSVARTHNMGFAAMGADGRTSKH